MVTFECLQADSRIFKVKVAELLIFRKNRSVTKKQENESIPV
jgi:hypothetical protein